jgi:hypothetical protein
MVVLDATTLLLLIAPSAKPPRNPTTGKPVERCKERLEFLLETLSSAGTRAVIPTPVLSEVLVGAGTAKNAYLTEITTSSAFMIAPFDVKAAVELAFLLDADGKQSKAKLTPQETWAKVKFDRQIVAVTKANDIHDIYTDDMSLSAVAEANGITVHHTWDLPLSPQKVQQELGLVVVPKGDDDDEAE